MISLNGTIHKFAKTKLIEYFPQLTEGEQSMFKRMYSHKNLQAPIEEIVEKMTVDKLDHAMYLCEKAINGRNQQQQ